MPDRVEDDDFVDVDVDITFKGWGEVHNSKKLYARGLARRMIEKDFGLKDLMETRNFATEHYEQAGSYTGTIRIGDRTIELGNTTGHRDHTWSTYAGHDGGQELDLAHRTVRGGHGCEDGQLQGGQTRHHGRLHLRKRPNRPLREIKLETEFEDDGLTQKSLRFSVEDTGGFGMDVEGRVVNPIPIVVADDDKIRSFAFEAMTEYTWQGRKAYQASPSTFTA